MSQRFSPRTWIAWAIACVAIVLVTRNPIYLGSLIASVLIVYLSLEHRSAIALAWSTVLRIGFVIAAVSIVFNVLTVHSGDRAFGSLPESWPIVGGPLTWNAVLYGAISGAALVCLLLIAATLSTAVDRAALIRLVPAAFGSIGIAAAAALSIFPQTIHAFTQVREAHRARGLTIRSLRDVQRLIVPVLNIGLERSFHLAESMESRAFGNCDTSKGVPTWIAFGTLVGFTTGVVLISVGSQTIGLVLLLASTASFLVVARRHSGPKRARYREVKWSMADMPVLLSALVVVVAVTLELARQESTLAYSTYPQLSFPSLSIPVLVACLLPAVPALALWFQPEVEHASA